MNNNNIKKKSIIHVKNMVCNRCILVVEQTLREMNYSFRSVSLGEIILEKGLSVNERESLQERLLNLGFVIIDDKKSRLIEEIKILVIELIYNKSNTVNQNLSSYISEKLNYDYAYLSNLFSEVEGITIEKYAILQRIERVKELLVYDELTLSEIAYKMGYSNVAYLSNQFKKITGLTPSYFKKVGLTKRKPLDQIGKL